MIDVPHDRDAMTKPGWYRHGPLVMLRCPNGHVGALDHEIAADGTVSPSVVCDQDSCTFHKQVRLLDWNAK